MARAIANITLVNASIVFLPNSDRAGALEMAVLPQSVRMAARGSSAIILKRAAIRHP
jgi:hypothetical protein